MLGTTRSMVTMMQFNEQKQDYDTVIAAHADDTEEYRQALAGCHERGAERCARVANMQRGIYIKAAQFIASIRGGTGERGIPRAYIEACSKFTDHAPHKSIAEVAEVLKECMYLGEWPQEDLDDACALKSLENEPIASASLAQVHRGFLQDGTKVAVKIQYPELRKEMASDFFMFRTMGATMKPQGYDLMWVIEDFEKNLTTELDFKLEAENGERTATVLAHLLPAVYVPKVYSEFSNDRVLTMEFCEDLIKANDRAGLSAQGLDVEECAALLCSAFAEMIFVHGRVHADPHAGNIYFRALGHGGARRPQLVILDHGMYFDLNENGVRHNFCRYWQACCAKDTATMNAIGQRFAGNLRRFLPLVLSPWFVFGGSGVSLREIISAAKGELPDTIGLRDVADFVVATRDGGANLIGLLHSLGYTRGILEDLGCSEGRRVALMLKYALLGDTPEPPAVPPPLSQGQRTWIRWRMAMLSGHIHMLALVARPLIKFAQAKSAPPLWAVAAVPTVLIAVGLAAVVNWAWPSAMHTL